jgi:hypothetical protein
MSFQELPTFRNPLNRHLVHEDKIRFSAFGPMFSLYDESYMDLNFDRSIKLAAQLDALSELGFKIDHPSSHKVEPGCGFLGKTVYDVGSGNSPMALMLASMGANAYAITAGPHKLEEYHPVIDHPNVTLVKDVDYLEYSKEFIKDSSVDLFLDGCSITHFYRTSNLHPNDGCYLVGKEIVRTMKPGGYFIVTSDVLIDADRRDDGYITTIDMINCYEAAGLILVGNEFVVPSQGLYVNNPTDCPAAPFYASRLVFTK